MDPEFPQLVTPLVLGQVLVAVLPPLSALVRAHLVAAFPTSLCGARSRADPAAFPTCATPTALQEDCVRVVEAVTVIAKLLRLVPVCGQVVPALGNHVRNVRFLRACPQVIGPKTRPVIARMADVYRTRKSVLAACSHKGYSVSAHQPAIDHDRAIALPVSCHGPLPAARLVGKVREYLQKAFAFHCTKYMASESGGQAWAL